MILFNVFNTEQESTIAENIDFAMHIAHNDPPNNYVATTKKWANPLQRLDGKWVYKVCPNGRQNYTKEEYSSDWFEYVPES